MIRYWENTMNFDYILHDELSIILGVLHINNSAFCEIEFHSTIEQMPLNECHIWWTDGIMFRIYTQNYYRKIWFYRNLHLIGQTNDTYAGWTHMCACVLLSENIWLWTRGIECLWRLNSVVLLDAHETSDNGKIFPLKLIPITGKTINIDHSDTCNFILITKKSTQHFFLCRSRHSMARPFINRLITLFLFEKYQIIWEEKRVQNKSNYEIWMPWLIQNLIEI